ncbi:unnamed protein product [Prunus brigantina]
MANRDQPVNGKRSKLSLQKTSNLILTDAGQSIVWATTTTSFSPAHLSLQNSGNLVLLHSGTTLISTRSQSNFSSGFYKLFFNNDNLLRLLFDGLEISSVYWPDPSRVSWDNARNTYNNSRNAMLDSLGSFISSDNLTFLSADYGAKLQRRLRIDFDGNVRLYSRENSGEKWVVSWQAISDSCMIHGICGANSVCSYDPGFGRKCSCLPGYHIINHTDWSFGCEPQFNDSYTKVNESSFLKLSQVEFSGYDYSAYQNRSYGESDLQGYLYLRLPKAYLFSNHSDTKYLKQFGLNCADRVIYLDRHRTRKSSKQDMHDGYLLAATGFKRFSYAELKKATRGEAEFLAEASTLGRLNHMHLIEMWGYCSEGKRKLLVYEYMEHGSLAHNLSSNVLNWEKRFEIAVGTAKGLAYLHEECLEWVLHCDVKPQNILLDSNYQPKVADFGLSKLFNRGELKNSSFSRIRGTRGYIAPEWVYNLPITSKVDVYSYGIVVLEMVTGKNPTMGVDAIDGEQRRLIMSVREKVNGTSAIGPQMGMIMDPSFEGEYDVEKMEILLRVALQCVEEDKDARPAMRQVPSSSDHYQNRTIVWMANRDQPVNGKRSKLSLLKTGNLILTDAGQSNVWATTTTSLSPVHLTLQNSGNLVLQKSDHSVLWQSFEFPTDTLLPHQPLTRNTILVSMRSQSNFSSGFYKLFFDNDNLLRLLYDGLQTSSVYWFEPWLAGQDAGRSTDNSSRIAVLDSLGNFTSSDKYTLMAADYGAKSQRRLTVDSDGNVRLYSRKKPGDKWAVSGQVISDPCKIHGICGANSVCSYDPGHGRKCSCIPGYRLINHTDWNYGCEPQYNYTCTKGESTFFKLSKLEFFGYDYGYFTNYTYEDCENLCLKLCNCKGFQYSRIPGRPTYSCYPKTVLLNGYRSPSFFGDLYLRVPKNHFTKPNSNEDMQGYVLAATGFKRFSYGELKKATRGFSEEIGRGAGGIVYKGVLADQRVAAIKMLNGADPGEAEFLGEANTIGRLNHMHLIEMWGFCSEGKHRLLVYEYMEHGSLAQNLSSNVLDWEKRFKIAVGTAKGLAYLHEECLEWVLHCDVKPQNILLDSNYQPKVADFGLSKLFNRGGLKNSSFSRIRGTRGYIAPEWVYNLPITSKVDVYSYGIVVLEMVTGKNPTMGVDVIDGEQRRLIMWVREKVNGTIDIASRMGEIIDPSFEGNYDVKKMEILLEVALHFSPIYSWVIHALQSLETFDLFYVFYFFSLLLPSTVGMNGLATRGGQSGRDSEKLAKLLLQLEIRGVTQLLTRPHTCGKFSSLTCGQHILGDVEIRVDWEGLRLFVSLLGANFPTPHLHSFCWQLYVLTPLFYHPFCWKNSRKKWASPLSYGRASNGSIYLKLSIELAGSTLTSIFDFSLFLEMLPVRFRGSRVRYWITPQDKVVVQGHSAYQRQWPSPTSKTADSPY